MKNLVGALTLALSVVVAGCSTAGKSDSSQKPKREDLYLQAAAGALQERDAIGALQYISEVDKSEPKNPLAAHMKALAFYMRGDLSSAEESGRRAVELDPKNSSFKTTLGQILIDAGKPQDAERVLAQAAADPLSRDSFKANTNLGILAYRRGDLATARTRLDQAIRDGGADACVAYYYRGHVNLAESKNSGALQDYESASRKTCGNFAEAHLAVGLVHTRNRNFEAARRKYVEINNLFPDGPVSMEAMKRLAELP